jgi:uncharacterized protein (DUF2062 family)
MLLNRLRRFVPSQEAIRANRWLRWLGPALHHPRLWHLSRRGLAMGVALGIFFGLLIPVAQIPLSAAAAVALRANLPSAVASTLVTNPATFGPIYYAAWRVGSALVGEPVTAETPEEMPEADVELDPVPRDTWLGHALARIMAVGKPLLLGLAVLATAGGLLSYALVSGLWALRVRVRRRRRLQEARR